MSSIAFNTAAHETVYLRGPERHHMSGIVHRMMMFAVAGWTADLIAKKGSPTHYVTLAAKRAIASEGTSDSYVERKRFDETLETYIRVGELDESGGLFPGKPLFEAALNTAIALGCPAIQLAARIHGQCEVHLWIADADTTAIADVMAEGRSLGIFRPEMGWEDVISLLRRDDTGDVVLSYSVTDSFPNEDIAIDERLPADNFDWSQSKHWDDATRERAEQATEDRSALWYDEFTPADRWAAAMRGLLATGGGLRLFATDLDGKFRFGDGTTGFDILGEA